MLTAGVMRSSTISEMACRVLLRRATGRRLEHSPRGLFGLGRHSRKPSPSSRGSPFVKLSLTSDASFGARTSAPYLSSSAGISSGLDARPLVSRLSAKRNSSAVIGVFRGRAVVSVSMEGRVSTKKCFRKWSQIRELEVFCTYLWHRVALSVAFGLGSRRVQLRELGP